MTSPRSSLRVPRLFLVAAVMVAAFAYPSAASADTLYAATGANNAAGNLYTLNPSTGAATLVAPIMIGATQVTHLSDLAVDPTTGTMYGFANSDFCCSPGTFDDGTLMTIDKGTGAATVIGTVGGVQLRASDMTFDRFGTLYAWSAGCGNDVECDTNASDLFTINKTTGAATKVGESGTVGFSTGLASDANGRMYVKDFESVYQVSPYTGHALVHEFSPAGLNNFNTGAVLTFGPSNVLYTGNRGGGSTQFQLQTLNPGTGTVTNVGSPNGVLGVSALEWDFTTPTAPNQADLSLGLSVNNATPTAGTDVTFTVTLTNSGPATATFIKVQDLLPSGFTFVSATPAQGSYSSSTGQWDVGNLGSAASTTLDIVATVHSTGIHTNTAQVSLTGTYDTDSVPGSSEGDTFDSARSAPAGTNTLYASSGQGPHFCDSEGNRYEDGSPASLYEIDPDDTSPAGTLGFRKVADITLGGTPALHVSGLAVDPTTGVLYGFLNTQDPIDCNLAPSGSGTLITIDKLTGAATVVGSMDAAAIVATDITFDPFGTLYAWDRTGTDLYTLDTTTGTATQVADCSCFPGSRIGLAVDSSGRMYLKEFGQILGVNQFTGQLFGGVGLSTSDPRDMLAFGPSDVLYSGSRNVSNFTWPQTFGLWTIDPSDGTTTLLDENSLQNVSALAWDLGTVTPPDQADLSLDKTVNDASPDDFGDQVTFTITVTNAGPDDATGVEVTDLLPSGFTYVSDNPDQGSYDSNTGIWTVGTILDTDSAVLEIVASVNTCCDYANVAEVTDSSTYDPDSVPGSGAGDTRDSQGATPTADPQVDLAADTIVSGPSRTTNTRKGFSVKITNVGEQTVTVTGGNLTAAINDDTGAVTCKAFSTTLKMGRSFKAACSADIASLGLTPGDTIEYKGTVDVPADGFPNNDTNVEVRTTS